ncbi:spore germination protein [Bacillus nakamurai]|uniref:Spore gernimation protein n=1 Tax=Bacillus nakamurai TaxID=1793963 RepID=A0A150F4Z8_9BACI|nr:spore germination protein [Bacillus nakamurai]KXZ17158.1 spore gernimation protein [Bacillus nakamurai]MCC9022415.1 spore germination protein [Bacillus nakamurai]MCP6682273.1 spore germination protein [Bacillus nakamurai]MED1228889.1 spore germination protein [Bacillus nakamurai]
MKQSEDKLSFMQTSIMVSGTMIGSGILTLPRSAALTDSPSGWIIILIEGAVYIGLVLLFMPFLLKNSEKTIYELNRDIMGRVLGSLLNVFISFYFILTICFQARFLGEVTNYFLLKNTPMGVVVFIFLAVGLYHVTGGVYPIAKVYAYIFPITVIILFVLLMFSLRLFKLDFIRPIMEGGYKSFFDLFPKTLIYFSGLEVIIYLVPFMKNPKQAKKAVAFGIGSSTLFYSITLFIVIGCMTIAEAKTGTWPTISLIHALEIQGIFIERFDIFLLVMWTCQQFTCMLGSFKGAHLGLNTLFRLKNKNNVWLLTGLLAVTFGFSMYPEDINSVFEYGTMLGYMFFAVIMIPFLIWFSSWMKKIFRRKQTS